MRQLIFIVILFFISTPAGAKHLYKESVYQQIWCVKRGGVMEYELPDKTRVDCLTDKYAVELDFAPKWAECIGQALYYGKMTGKQPACVLIMERGEKDFKYLRRLRRAVYRKGLDMRTFTITPAVIAPCSSS